MRAQAIAKFLGMILAVAIVSELFIAFGYYIGLMGTTYFEGTSSDFVILGTVLLPTLIATLIGWFLGSRLTMEGGRKSQIITGLIMGAIFAMPVSCVGLWYTGW
jgi:hypothetical protein